MWDIYLYDNVFYFSRSWTGELRYKATAKIHLDAITLTSLEYPSAENESLAINNIHFLMMSHAFDKIFPHMVPKELVDSEMIVAYSFLMFGVWAVYACHEPIVDAVVVPGKSPRAHVSFKSR